MGAGLALVAALTVDRAARAAEHTAASGASECNTSNLLAGRSPSAAQEVAGNAVLVTDGVIAPEGTPWDSPDAVRLAGTSAFLIFDLGGTHKVSALYLQADANDTYTISGSRDGKPGSFRVLTEFANVVDRGHGLRARSLQIEPTTLR